MERIILEQLEMWLDSTSRKPLIIRGARQVGKTWLVRHFVERKGLRLIELNFENNRELLSLFSTNNIKTILLNLTTITGYTIDPEKDLLFLDEIQVEPILLAKLRWFAENEPRLPVIAAGSLLEFVLSEHEFSMPVGRISYMHVEPLSFEEFLLANNKQTLLSYLSQYSLKDTIPLVIHQECSLLFKTYLLVGGMPAVVDNWIHNQSLTQISQIQHDLINTYRDDFSKYRKKYSTHELENIFLSIPRQLGLKIIYSRMHEGVVGKNAKQILQLLEKARICHRISLSAANGVPLGAETKEKYFKEIMLDVGLCGALLGLNLQQLNTINDINLINKGAVAEQVVGQLLRTLFPPYMEPSLYYWAREETGSNAELDYVIQQGTGIIPIEVKSGSSGSLKSLHLFMKLKKYKHAVRINSDIPSKVSVDVKDQLGDPCQYELLSIPFYLIGQLPRLINEIIA